MYKFTVYFEFEVLVEHFIGEKYSVNHGWCTFCIVGWSRRSRRNKFKAKADVAGREIKSKMPDSSSSTETSLSRTKLNTAKST